MEIPDLINPNRRDELYAKWKPTIDKTFDIFTWTSGHELAALCEFATRATSIVEVGSYHGKAGTRALIFSGDTKAASFARTPFLPLLATRGPYDLGFVDGGHLEADVTADIQNLLPHMAPGAILAGHDWQHGNPLDGVNVAVEKAFDRHRIRVFETIWFVQLP